jgi:hypothetical protein
MSIDSTLSSRHVTEARLPVVENFVTFVTKAETIVNRSAAGVQKPQLIPSFLTFVTKSRAIIQNPASTAYSFQRFIDKAMPLIFADIKQLLPQIIEGANLVARWLVEDDLLAVAGCRLVENAYTELMAWALNPDTHPASARQRQAAWLAVLGLDKSICDAGVCSPHTQVRTEDGSPDLVMQFEEITIGVEAKTGSAEHLTPSGKMQTVAYAESLREALDLRPEHTLKVVFITPDGRQASNDDAICTTYIAFVLALAGALDGHEIPPDTRTAFAIFFTHMLTCATSLSIDVPDTVKRIRAWSTERDWCDNEQINQRWGLLLEAVKFLKPERQS